MIFIFDTETTGMIRWREPITHPEQPRVVQFGAGLYHPDGTELSAISLLVNSGISVEPEAATIHGIDEGLLRTAGISSHVVLDLLEELAKHASLLVCHNVNFDRKMLEIECAAEDCFEEMALSKLPTFCTMQATTPLCRILKQNPRHSADYKWPKLGEAYKHFFNEPLVGAHDALRDVRACARIYFHLRRGPIEPVVP